MLAKLRVNVRPTKTGECATAYLDCEAAPVEGSGGLGAHGMLLHVLRSVSPEWFPQLGLSSPRPTPPSFPLYLLEPASSAWVPECGC